MPDLAGERYAIGLATNTLAWLLGEGRLEAIHPGLRATLTAARTQLDAAIRLSKEEG